ncbi:MAG: hypothetical protein WKF33_04325 [Thermoleophilaceae bacterium]
MALSVGVGLGVLTELMEGGSRRGVGPRGHDPDRVAVRHGHKPGAMTLGGRERPRALAAAAAPLAIYAHFAVAIR